MVERPHFTLRFADGDPLELGRRTRVMGVLNVTPDSFSDGGRNHELSAALDAAAEMIDQGADLIDVGGESTQPGATPVGITEEANRVLPVVEGIKRRMSARISVDTMKPEVARRAIDSGADMVNDVSGLSNPDMLPLIVESRVPLVVMHMRGTPRTMQSDTAYDDLLASVRGFLEDCVGTAVAAGVSGDKIVVDPGIGFGKSAAGSLQLLRHLHELQRTGQPILVGASRKSFIGATLGLPVDERLEGSLAVAAYASANGAHIIRAHDVAATLRAVRMIDSIREA
jgi:dihydropteroate synthase